MRTPNSVGYENQTLLQIATSIAAKYQLQVIGLATSLNPRFARVTQNQESDLEFLKRLATAHGYEFSVRGAGLTFYSRAALEAQPALARIMRSVVERFAFENRTHRI